MTTSTAAASPEGAAKPTPMVSSFITMLGTGNTTRILLLKRSPTASPFPSLWAACSGRIEASDHTPQLAALREIKEETSISANRLKLVKAGEPFQVGGGNKTWKVWSFLWAVKFGKGEESREGDAEDSRSVEEQTAEELVKLNGENVQAKWVTFEEIADMQTVPGLRGTVGRLLNIENSH
ncbi:Initiation factor 2B-like protein [Thelotrema lepadinum]|nr:Initiation factor 2B-like protein [Thelotrema lepadinum]